MNPEDSRPLDDTPLVGVGLETDVSELLDLAKSWTGEVRRAKARVEPRDFEWYPYNTLSNLEHFDRLLTGPNRRLLKMIGDRPLLDLGCGDGELSLFFAALGCRVLSMDYGPTNHNEMRGIRSLKSILASSIEIGEVDFDSQFSLEGVDCGLAFLLGVIYHLKNPVYVLEMLSKHAKFCIMSTKTASMLPDRRTSIAEWPVGYLLAADELNKDDSNFWIFSDAGFRRLLGRTNWTVLDYWKYPEVNSSPESLGRDERVYCLAQSTYGLANLSLLDGWYEPEVAGWRWTKRCFSVEIPRTEKRPKVLKMKFYVPPKCIQRKALNLTARTGSKHGSKHLFSIAFDQPGLHTVTRRVTPTAGEHGDRLGIDFELDRALAAEPGDDRERGIIVSEMDLR